MFKLFLKGVVFGTGFSITVALIGFVFVNYFNYTKITNSSHEAVSKFNWHELTDEQQISKATVLAIARYSKADDGGMTATITEIYKDDASINLNYKVGDIYPKLKYYPREHDTRSGAVIFFTSSPAEHRSTLYLYDDRVISYGDMPLEVLINKFKYSDKKQSAYKKLGTDISEENSSNKVEIPFHELGVEDLIKQSSVIALAKFEISADGKIRAIIKEFLKKDPSTTIYYNIGDEERSSSHYPKGHTDYGDGAIIFYTGSPAKNRMSTSYRKGRIPMFGDMPLELFKKKCIEFNA